MQGVLGELARLLKLFSVSVLLVTALAVGGTADARSLHRAAKATQATVAKPDAKIPAEQKTRSAGVALDRKLGALYGGLQHRSFDRNPFLPMSSPNSGHGRNQHYRIDAPVLGRNARRPACGGRQ
jgi:hypothetical protein